MGKPTTTNQDNYAKGNDYKIVAPTTRKRPSKLGFTGSTFMIVLDGMIVNVGDVSAYTLPFGGFLLLRTTNAPAEAEARVLLLQGP